MATRALIVFACACAAPTTPRAVNAPTIDGVVGDAEWTGARGNVLERGVQLRVIDDGAKVYFGIRGGTGFACVFIAGGERVVVHHASAKLGIAVYVRASDGTYDPRAKDYAWKAADVMLREQGWTASTMRPEVHDQELAFQRETIGSRRIAIGYLMLPESNDLEGASVVTWPTGLTDGVANVQLIAGFNPDDVAFAPERWAVIGN